MTDGADFQRRSSQEGRQANEIAGQVLAGSGFTISRRNFRLSDIGITANYIALDHVGDEWLFDVAGAFTSNQPGLIRTDTMWKTLGRANVLHQLGYSRLIFLTTNLPPAGTVGDKALRAASLTFFDAIEMVTREGKLRLRHYAQGGADLTPLVGYRTAAQAYGDAATSSQSGALAVPLSATGDPIPVSGAHAEQLAHRTKVFLPSLTDDGTPIAPGVRDRAKLEIKTILSTVAGGCTAHDGKGSWIHPGQGVVDEDVTAIEAYSSQPLAPDVVGAIVRVVLDDLSQHTAAVIIGECMHLWERDALDALDQN